MQSEQKAQLLIVAAEISWYDWQNTQGRLMSNAVDKSSEWTIDEEQRLVQFVRSTLGVSATKAKGLIERGHFSINGQCTKKPGAIMPSGTRLTYEAAGRQAGGPAVFESCHGPIPRRSR